MPDHDAIMEAKLKMIDETHRFVPKRSALLIIDMQHGFVDEGASLEVAAALDFVHEWKALQRRTVTCHRDGGKVVVRRRIVELGTNLRRVEGRLEGC